jgi:mannosyltransferase OCH1-like enzyme
MLAKLPALFCDYVSMSGRKSLYITLCVMVVILLLSTNSSSFQQSSEREVKEKDSKQRVHSGGNPLIKIPKIIIQTLKAKNLDDLYFRRSNHSITTLHPDYEHMVLGDHEQKEWVRNTYPLIYPFYANFTHDIQRSDFIRFLLIYHYGGYYFDSDVVVMQKIETWYSYDDTDRQNISALFGIEGHNPKVRVSQGIVQTWRPRQVASWAFAAEPRHPLLDYMVKLILSKRVARLNPAVPTSSYLDQVVEFASPAVFSDAIASFLLMKGASFDALYDADGDKMVDGIYLASERAFACGAMWSESIV